MTTETASVTGQASWLLQYLDAWNRHDLESVTAFMTDDVVFIDTPLGQRLVGRAEVRTFIDSLRANFSTNYQITPGLIITTDEAYSYEWVSVGTNDCDNTELGVPATGKPFEIRGISIGVLKDGKIKENRDYWDVAGYLKQVGLMPAPESSNGATA
ncbi:ester cyclase [Allosalinactinospora lopnorensis]|uniref:ester cyclase n=1 Tax=Allosalinactinospora lopnorensis TaxID=1352348 RepID=UPI000696837E|nr:nuclear transport factor 2 family protein [Allosalinactinospora lopnorensis]